MNKARKLLHQCSGGHRWTFKTLFGFDVQCSEGHSASLMLLLGLVFTRSQRLSEAPGLRVSIQEEGTDCPLRPWPLGFSIWRVADDLLDCRLEDQACLLGFL